MPPLPVTDHGMPLRVEVDLRHLRLREIYSTQAALVAAATRLADDLAFGEGVRQLYLAVAKTYSDLVLRDVLEGKVPPEAAMAQMHEMRGIILEASRAR